MEMVPKGTEQVNGRALARGLAVKPEECAGNRRAGRARRSEHESSMIVAGIDVGAKNVHVVLLQDGALVARATVPSGFDHEESAARGLAEAARVAGIDARTRSR